MDGEGSVIGEAVGRADVEEADVEGAIVGL